jgi:two-component system, LuxR family, sensor histidine kinase TtrS
MVLRPTRQTFMCKILPAIIMLTLFIWPVVSGNAAASEVRIGVLPVNGPEQAIKYWKPVSDYLSAQIPEHHFTMVPIDYKNMDRAVANDQLEFVIANPSQYIEYEVKYNASRIATLLNHVGPAETSLFGSVIFTRADRKDIETLADLKGKSFVTVSETAFAAWHVTRYELQLQGISSRDLGSVKFTGIPTENVVMAVKNGEAVAGAVRTDLLEKMSLEGKIDLNEFRILNKQVVPGFPFLLSTQLYPEFAFARLRNTDAKLANKIAAQLLLMPHDTIAKTTQEPIGWAVPDNYESVRTLLKDLKLPPYQNYGKVTIGEALRQHWIAVVLGLVAILSSFLAAQLTFIVKRRNRYIAEQQLLEESIKNKVMQLEAALGQVKQLEGIINICAYCKKIRNDVQNWQQIEQYIVDHSNAHFSHSICPECYKKELLEFKAMQV